MDWKPPAFNSSTCDFTAEGNSSEGWHQPLEVPSRCGVRGGPWLCSVYVGDEIPTQVYRDYIYYIIISQL